HVRASSRHPVKPTVKVRLRTADSDVRRSLRMAVFRVVKIRCAALSPLLIVPSSERHVEGGNELLELGQRVLLPERVTTAVSPIEDRLRLQSRELGPGRQVACCQRDGQVAR